MIRLDFYTNFNREGRELNSANGRGLPLLKNGTGLGAVLFRCCVFILFSFSKMLRIIGSFE
ncbi:MAG: hypothetical protein D3914_10520 [Candidatus Electrothrix sp. LOE2]|nr:hypothetical protein [Candidatus Electrothrix sp. LOE2]